MRALYRAVPFALVCMTTWMASAAGAQSVRGTVTDEASFPVGRAMVLLLDSTLSVADRVVTGERGEFVARSAAGGTYRLRVVRIGYRATLSDAFTLAPGQTIEQALVVSSARVQLSAVNVQGRRSCGRAVDYGNDAERTGWEQAMASMANVVTSSSAGFLATTLVMQRELDGSGRRVQSQRVRTRTARVSEPWISLPVDSLRRNGYVFTDETDSLTFVAPSAAVLLSDAFLEDHCIEPVSGSDSSEFGILFTPAPSRRHMAEVRGVLWLSRGSAELRRLEFSYVNVPGMQNVPTGERVAPGGLLEFSRLADGTVVITNWEIRMPGLSELPRNRGMSRVLQVIGGRTVLLRRNRDTLYRAPLLSVGGVVRDSSSDSGLAGVSVRLSGTGTRVVTDAQGRFAMRDVLPGQYVIETWTDSLGLIGVRTSTELTLTEPRNDVDLVVPTLAQATRSMCPEAVGNRNANAGGGVVGMVRTLADTGAVALANVRVVASWSEIRSRANRLGELDKLLETRSAPNGTYALCGVPLNVPISVRALLTNGPSTPEQVRLDKSWPVATVFLTVEDP